jgi:hypothetical protein
VCILKSLKMSKEVPHETLPLPPTKPKGDDDTGPVELLLADITVNLATELPLSVPEEEEEEDNFEKRGVKLVLLRNICSHVRRMHPHKVKWSVAEIKNEIIGSHEVLRDDYWWVIQSYSHTVIHTYIAPPSPFT